MCGDLGLGRSTLLLLQLLGVHGDLPAVGSAAAAAVAAAADDVQIGVDVVHLRVDGGKVWPLCGVPLPASGHDGIQARGAVVRAFHAVSW